MFFQVAGYLSGLAMLLSFVPYIRDIFRGSTKPERISWLIWAVLGSISFASLSAKGASFSLFLPGAQALVDLMIFVLAIKYGMGGFTRRDVIALIAAAVGLILWYIFNEAAVALFIAIFIDATGVVLTTIKAYEKPETETVSTWVLTFLAGVFSVIAVGKLNWILLSFPIYIALAGLSIMIAIWLGKRRKVYV